MQMQQHEHEDDLPPSVDEHPDAETEAFPLTDEEIDDVEANEEPDDEAILGKSFVGRVADFVIVHSVGATQCGPVRRRRERRWSHVRRQFGARRRMRVDWRSARFSPYTRRRFVVCERRPQGRGCSVLLNTEIPLMSRRSTVISAVCASMFTSPKN
jgi:hypothetical protein